MSNQNGLPGTDSRSDVPDGHPMTPTEQVESAHIRLSALDRWLPAWIGIAMATGLLLGQSIPGPGSAIDAVQIGGISLPITLGPLVMMHPVLAKVRYDRLGVVTSDRRLLITSLALNRLAGPAVMFALAWSLLPDLPEYRTGLSALRRLVRSNADTGRHHRSDSRKLLPTGPVGQSAKTSWPFSRARPAR